MKDNNMDNLDLDTVLNEAQNLFNHVNNLKDELNRMKDDEDFLINEYKINKKWFRDNPGKVTIEDVIKTCYEFGWAARHQFDMTK